mgnify:CR=1 FL=1
MLPLFDVVQLLTTPICSSGNIAKLLSFQLLYVQQASNVKQAQYKSLRGEISVPILHGLRTYCCLQTQI